METLRKIASTRVFLFVVFLSLILPVSDRVMAQGHPSARIYSMGGDAVVGIVPDFLTDLYLNPAYASLAEGLTINYGYRIPPPHDTYFPYLKRSYDSFYFTDYFSSISGKTNELTAYGIKLSDWSLALSTEWRLDWSETTDSHTSLYQYSRATREEYFQNYDKNDDYYFRFDISAARRFGEKRAVGFRAGGTGYNNKNINRDRELDMYYRFDDFPFEIYSYEQGKYDDLSDQAGRQITYFLQAGVLQENSEGDPSSVSARVSRKNINTQIHEYDQTIGIIYDEYYDPYEYHYILSEWRDKRNGNLWKYELMGRHTLHSGLRIFIGGSLATASYETAWNETTQDLRWTSSEQGNTELSGAFSGEGSFEQTCIFAKAGKTFSIRRNIDLTTGLHTSFNKAWSDESTTIHYDLSDSEYQTEVSYGYDHPFKLNTETTDVSFSVPIALDFQASKYFSLYSGFVINIQWKKTYDEMIMPTLHGIFEGSGIYLGCSGWGAATLSNPSSPQITDGSDKQSWSSSHSAVLGFSLHYSDRLFLDVYTASDPTPDSITNLVIDARYRF